MLINFRIEYFILCQSHIQRSSSVDFFLIFCARSMVVGFAKMCFGAVSFLILIKIEQGPAVFLVGSE